MSAPPPLPERPVEPPNVYMATGEPVSDGPPTVSPRLSFKGWLFAVWLARNKGFVKTVLAPVSAILTGGVLEPSMLKLAAVTAGLGLLTIAFRLAWDAFDYFVSDVPGAAVKEPRP